jgi:polyhydroxybutyrate depolymerase
MAVVPGATESRAQTDVLGTSETASTTIANADAAAAVDEAPGASAAAVSTPTAPETTIAQPPTALPTTVVTTAHFSPAEDIQARPLPDPLAVGVNEQQMPVGGLSRNYLAVVPPPTVKPRSLLIVLHGVNGRGANMRSMGFEPSAAANGTVVVYPDAVGGSWNDGRVGMEPMQAGMVTDDVAFLRALIDEMIMRANVDATRVAVAGFSNGAMMASRVACEMPDRVHGAALVGGTAGQNYSQVCLPSRTVPIVEVHGTSDPVVPYAGGKVADNQGRKRGSVLSVADFVTFWSGTCHCSGTRETPIKASMAVTMVEAQACTPGSPVVHYRVTGGAHEWFRMQGFDTTKVVWDFLAANSFA